MCPPRSENSGAVLRPQKTFRSEAGTSGRSENSGAVLRPQKTFRSEAGTSAHFKKRKYGEAAPGDLTALSAKASRATQRRWASAQPTPRARRGWRQPRRNYSIAFTCPSRYFQQEHSWRELSRVALLLFQRRLRQRQQGLTHGSAVRGPPRRRSLRPARTAIHHVAGIRLPALTLGGLQLATVQHRVLERLA
jgi:hypothetical protein